MKIRNGFVSNSSSSSFIVAVTRNYQFSQEEKNKILESYIKFTYSDNKISTIEELEQELPVALNELCKGDGIFNDYTGYHYLIDHIATQADICLIDIDTDPCSGFIINVLADEYRNKIKNLIK